MPTVIDLGAEGGDFDRMDAAASGDEGAEPDWMRGKGGEDTYSGKRTFGRDDVDMVVPEEGVVAVKKKRKRNAPKFLPETLQVSTRVGTLSGRANSY